MLYILLNKLADLEINNVKVKGSKSVIKENFIDNQNLIRPGIDCLEFRLLSKENLEI